ncbi:MAG: gas vesicle protein GvpG [Armatimonadetes bacterium]|nr:gas vesicle protein GvpG [Armatimonadota bacterium]
MLLVDDVLLAPVHGIFWIFREIRNAAEQDLRQEADAIAAQLMQLYLMLDAGSISEAQFQAREATLLDRLDRLQGIAGIPDDGSATDESEEDGDYEYVYDSSPGGDH